MKFVDKLKIYELYEKVHNELADFLNEENILVTDISDDDLDNLEAILESDGVDCESFDVTDLYMIENHPEFFHKAFSRMRDIFGDLATAFGNVLRERVAEDES